MSVGGGTLGGDAPGARRSSAGGSAGEFLKLQKAGWVSPQGHGGGRAGRVLDRDAGVVRGPRSPCPPRLRRRPGGRSAGGTRAAKGADTLVIAPTGSGKTLAAFLWAIDRASGRRARPSPIVWKRPATSCSPSRAFRKANGNRSARRMRSSDCMKSSSDGSRCRPCCLPRKLPRCCSGLCWLLARSRSQSGRLAKPQRKAFRSNH